MSIQAIRLPRAVERDPRSARLLEILTSNTVPLWRGAEIEVPGAGLSAGISAALRSAQSAGRVARGLEGAERTLAAEERGLRLLSRRTGVDPGGRVSRILLLSRDGAERFYRRVERLLIHHAPRVMAIRLDVDAAGLGELLYGPGRPARLLMIGHKEAVCEVLLAMV